MGAGESPYAELAPHPPRRGRKFGARAAGAAPRWLTAMAGRSTCIGATLKRTLEGVGVIPGSHPQRQPVEGGTRTRDAGARTAETTCYAESHLPVACRVFLSQRIW